MLLILLSCLVIGSATSCTLPDPINSTISLDDLVDKWYVQLNFPGPPQNSYSCWTSDIKKTTDGYELVTSAIDSSGKRQNVTGKFQLKPGSGNVIQTVSFRSNNAEYKVLGVLSHRCVIYGACLPDGDTAAYYVETTTPSPPDKAEENVIKEAVEKLGLEYSTFVKNCQNPDQY